MTTIVVKKEKEYIHICSDSQFHYNEYKYLKIEKNIKNSEKICKIDDIVIWFAWSLESLLKLKQYISSEKPEWSKLEDIENYIVKWYKQMKERKEIFRMEENDKYNIDNNEIIIIFENKIFHIQWNYIFEVNEYDAIWSWTEFAFTALYLWKNAKKSCKIATELDLNTGGKINEIKIPLNNKEKKWKKM